MALFLTGDTHGDFRRFLPESFYEQERLTKEDLVLVCGDMGGVWYGDCRDDEGLDFLERRPFTTLFVVGNHENYDALRTYPLEDWRGGKIRRIRPSVLLLERGQVFDLNGKRIFTMGGASSHDIQGGILEPDDPLFLLKFHTLEVKGTPFRVNHRSWWKEELPSPEEYLEARRNLDKAGWEVDYIITHCAPTSIQNDLLRERSKPDELTDFLEEVRQRCRFRYHFFGHYHGDGIIQKQFVRGLTTAAGIWATAGIGLAVGSGMYGLGIAATLLTLAGLELLSVIFKSIGMRSSLVVFSTSDKEAINRIARVIYEKGFLLVSYDMKRLGHQEKDEYVVSIVLKARKNTEESPLLLLMEQFPEVTVERIE